MKSSTDWRDTLGALLQNAPEATVVEHKETADSQLTKTAPLQKLRIDIERKGRGGKTATIISGFSLSDDEVSEIAAELKKKLGTGGSARGGEILIQGDRRKEVQNLLRNMNIIK